ncbi:vWA domain-containing protein [Phytoactinopolyspora mesophila]|uniref:VWA domain-containing protein n=1 Tax=Phytoactinopolyspora mesophila TaxID=2650750 RepID=A0A7K3LX43_9ACTN|nr:VWA domain-containing protein [Phytoactinopolyspora mesophila]NDL55599.1 VWA domain-containing protein [Phytoactinopolyspora mesophila]
MDRPGTHTTADDDAVGAVVEFAGRLRAAGARVPPTRVHAMIRALGELGADSLASVYWSGRLTLCASPEDIDRFDHVFAAYFSGRPERPRPRVAVEPSYQLVARPADTAGNGDQHDDEPQPPEQLATASRLEVLRHRDVAELGVAERAEVQRFVSLLVPAGPQRLTHRLRASPSGTVDPRRTVRTMLRHGGEPAELLHRRRARRYRRLVFIIDVSGSMAPYADTLLRFAHAACQARPGTEAFTVGTRLTRVTRELRMREPGLALAAASAAIPDWRGGTRLGAELKEFLDRWGQRGSARGAVVVIASDGWERGDPAPLGEQMARLRRFARHIVWVNPHRGRAGFVPRTGGMLAAIPHIDRLVAGHSLAAMEELARTLGKNEPQHLAGLSGRVMDHA